LKLIDYGYISPPEAVPKALSTGTGLGMWAIMIYPILGFNSSTFDSKVASCALHSNLYSTDGVFTYVMFLKLG
jgi:hypothetical protein